MENRKNTERKTVIKTQKNDGCFLTPSLRKPPTSTHTKQIHKNLQTLDTTTKIEVIRSLVIKLLNIKALFYFKSKKYSKFPQA